MLIKENFDLTDYNSYRVNATCSKAYFPESDQDLIDVFSEIGESNKHIIGAGYNLILSKEHYEDPFVIFSDNFSDVLVEGDVIVAQSGITMLQLTNLCYEKGLSGLEIFYDIPGSLGGAVVMNAGSGTEEVKNLVSRVKCFDIKNLTFELKENSDLGFDYRRSIFQENENLIVVEATLQLSPGIPENIKEKMERTKAIRHTKQPKDYPNAGSVFKRPTGQFVGPMIEGLGLKGFSIGGAQVSEKHAGFIVNCGNATGADILSLIDHIKQLVFNAYGIELEVEQRIL